LHNKILHHFNLTPFGEQAEDQGPYSQHFIFFVT
jgi:hypothetical protein